MICAKSSISIKVEGQVSQPYLCPGPYNADTSKNHITGPLCLDPENMLHPGSYSRACPVSLLLPTGHLTTASSFSLEMLSETVGLQPADGILRAIRRISPDIPAAVVWIQQFFKDIAVMNIGAGHRILPDELVGHINRYMILVSEKALVVLFGPAGIGIFLAFFVFAPSFRLVTVFDLLVFLAAVALYRNPYNRGIDYLSFLRTIAVFTEIIVKGSKKLGNLARSCQIFTKTPDGCCVWNLAGGMETKKPGKRVSVKNLIFQSVITEV